MKEEESNDTMIGFVESGKVSERVDSSSERSIEPSSTLTDKFRSAFGDIAVRRDESQQSVSKVEAIDRLTFLPWQA